MVKEEIITIDKLKKLSKYLLIIMATKVAIIAMELKI